MMRAVLALWLVVGCSTSKTPKPEITSPKTSKQTTSSSWHGLPSAPGLPDKLSRLTFGMDRALIVGDLSALLDGAGFALSPKSSAKAKLSADGRLRYLTVTVQASSQALTAAWPKSRVAQIDNRHSAVVWYLPKRGVQIQMRGIGANKADGIDMAGQAVKIFVLQRLQMVAANFKQGRHVVERRILRLARGFCIIANRLRPARFPPYPGVPRVPPGGSVAG